MDSLVTTNSSEMFLHATPTSNTMILIHVQTLGCLNSTKRPPFCSVFDREVSRPVVPPKNWRNNYSFVRETSETSYEEYDLSRKALVRQAKSAFNLFRVPEIKSGGRDVWRDARNFHGYHQSTVWLILKLKSMSRPIQAIEARFGIRQTNSL